MIYPKKKTRIWEKIYDSKKYKCSKFKDYLLADYGDNIQFLLTYSKFEKFKKGIEATIYKGKIHQTIKIKEVETLSKISKAVIGTLDFDKKAIEISFVLIPLKKTNLKKNQKIKVNIIALCNEAYIHPKDFYKKKKPLMGQIEQNSAEKFPETYFLQDYEKSGTLRGEIKDIKTIVNKATNEELYHITAEIYNKIKIEIIINKISVKGTPKINKFIETGFWLLGNI